MPGGGSAATRTRAVAWSQSGISVPTIGAWVSGWLALTLISAPVPETVRVTTPEDNSIASSMLPARQKLSAGLSPVAILATAR